MPHSPLRRIGTVLAAVLIIWISSRYLLPLFLPFVLATLLALAAEPLVGVLARRCRMPRWLASGLGICIALTLVILSTLVCGALLLRELGSLAEVVPNLESTALQGMDLLRNWLFSIADQVPDGVKPIVNHSLNGIFSGSSQLLDRVSVWLLSFASGVLKALPDSALGLGTWILASFMISAKLPKIRGYAASLVPGNWKKTYLPALGQLRKSLGGWLLAQLKLTGITACVLSAGFLVLQIPYGIAWALLISLVDALPILGTGTVLIPWSTICFLQGDSLRSVGLLVIYAAVALLRSVLEPRLVGKQLGLDPLVTLVAMYAGYQLWGLGGMLLAPLLAVTVTQLLVIPKAQ